MRPGTRSFYALAVQRTVEHLVQHLDDALELEALARQACLSRFHFHRVFRGMVGETPLELHRRLRMERAAHRLARTESGVTEIAFDAGYETHEAFTRAFRQCYSTSPSRFRQRRYPRIELGAPCGVHYDPGGSVAAFIPRDSGGHMMDVEIREMPAQRVAAVRHIGPYNQIPVAFERLHTIVAATPDLQRPTSMLAVYHDDPETTSQDELRSDAGVVVPDGVTLPKGLTEQRLPAGRYARTLHVGPYEELGDVWARFMGEWLPASGHRVGSGPSYEIYLNTPMTAQKEQLRTELYIPLA